MKTIKTLSWFVVLAGVWEISAPYILGYSGAGAAVGNAITLGTALVILAAWAALASQESVVKGLSWTDALLGAWLVIAPFTLGYASNTAATWNDITLGVIALALSTWAALALGERASGQSPSHGHMS